MPARKEKKDNDDRKASPAPMATSNNPTPPLRFYQTNPATQPKKPFTLTVPKLSERLLSLWVDHDFDWRDISLNIQEPELHQIVMSWCWYPSPLGALTEVFGSPTETKNKKTGEVRGYEFPNGLYLKKKPAKNTFWHTIRFNADNDILTGLASIAAASSRYWKGVLRVQIKNAEVAQNIPFPGKPYMEVERVALAILAIAIPKDPNTVLVIKRDKKNSDPEKKGKGRITAYFKKVRRNKAGELVFVKEQPHEIKIYLKKILGVWNIRIEQTFSKDHLKANRIPIGLPASVSPGWISKGSLHNTLTFAKIKRKKFAKTLGKRLRSKAQPSVRYRVPHRYQILWAATANLPAAEQKHTMYALAKSVAERLRQRASSGEFENEVELFAE